DAPPVATGRLGLSVAVRGQCDLLVRERRAREDGDVPCTRWAFLGQEVRVVLVERLLSGVEVGTSGVADLIEQRNPAVLGKVLAVGRVDFDLGAETRVDEVGVDELDACHDVLLDRCFSLSLTEMDGLSAQDEASYEPHRQRFLPACSKRLVSRDDDLVAVSVVPAQELVWWYMARQSAVVMEMCAVGPVDFDDAGTEEELDACHD